MTEESQGSVPKSIDWRFVDDWQKLHSDIDGLIRAEFSSYPKVKVLEAGCGTKWSLSVDDLPLYIVGLDESMDAIEYRRTNSGDLDEFVHGDLTTTRLPADSFDVIYCSYVLEHVAGARNVLDNFVDWLKPGGLLIVKIPDRNSVFGFLTRLTPHPLHVAYKKYMMKNRNAGKEGHDPFPTVYDPVISITGTMDFIESHRLVPMLLYRTEFYPAGMRLTRILIRSASRILQFLSFGQLRGDYSGLAIVVKKPN